MIIGDVIWYAEEGVESQLKLPGISVTYLADYRRKCNSCCRFPFARQGNVLGVWLDQRVSFFGCRPIGVVIWNAGVDRGK